MEKIYQFIIMFINFTQIKYLYRLSKKNLSQFSDENIPKLVGKPFFDPLEVFSFQKEKKLSEFGNVTGIQ